MEDVPAPVVDAQAIDMLSGHPDSDNFIEEYRRWRATNEIVDALIFTGQTYQLRHQGEQPPR
jgi:hypothetical protein